MIERLTFESGNERLPPSNVEAEEAVLGSILLDREAIGRVSSLIEPESFYRARNGTIFAAMVALYERQVPIDYLTLIDELERTGALESAGGVVFLSSLLGAVPTPLHIVEYARSVAHAAYMRRLISAGGKISALGYRNDATDEEAATEAERLIRSAERTHTTGQVVTVRDELMGLLDDPNNPDDTNVVPTGFLDVDRILAGGFRRGDLIVLAGRPGMGKSAYSMCIAAKLTIHHGGSALVFSMEMSARSLVERLVATESGVNLQAIMQRRIAEHHMVRVGDAFGRLAEARLWIDPTPALTVAEIRTRARRHHADHPLDLIVIDHLQLIAGSRRGQNEVEKLTEISGALKAMAKDLGVPVLALSQLNREVEQRHPKIPVLSDLRSSGSIEQDSDVVLLLYRPAYYDPQSPQYGIAEVHVAKNRNGRMGDRIHLAFQEEVTRFDNLEVTR